MSHRVSTSNLLLRCLALFLGALSLGETPLAATPAPVTVLFMGAASAGGAGGTFWSSELVLANVNQSPSEILLEIIPRESAAVAAGTTLTLAAGETRRLPDVYAALNAGQGAGTLRVTGDVLAWMRTFNQTSSGTFGMGVPSVTDATAFGADGLVYFPVSTPADVQKEFRSNLLLLNLETTNATFTVASGNVLKTQEVGPGTFVQIDRVGGWLGLPAGRAVLSVWSTGSWHGLVSTIDPATGDPTGVRGLRATPRTVTFFNGVASADGVGGTKWRSEAQLFNTRDAATIVTLELVPRGESGVTATKTLSLAAGETRLLADVYTTLGVGSGAGTLKVKGDVLTWVRTFNQGVGATFGTEIPEVVPGIGYGTGAIAVYPIVVPADVSKDFRSNFLVYNHESRAVTLTLTSGTASRTLDVPANTFLQKDSIGNWIGLAPGTTTMRVTGNGRWSALVTTIDPGLGDPTGYLGVLATPNPMPTERGTPIGSAITATIGPAGGSLSSQDGRLTLNVPAGALATSKTFTVQPVTNLAWGGLGNAYSLGPEGTTFATPSTITFAPTADDTSAINLEGLGIGYQDGDGYWQWISSATRDTAANRISVSTSHLSPWSLLTGLVLMPPSASVKVGEKLDLRIHDCYPSDDDDPLAPLVQVPGVPCQSVRVFVTSWWSVEGVIGGTGTFGTVQGDGTRGHYTAPAKAPSPNTVAVTATVNRYFTLRNITLVSHVTIGGNLKGTLNVQMVDDSGGSYVPITVEATDATLEFAGHIVTDLGDVSIYSIAGTWAMKTPQVTLRDGTRCTCQSKDLLRPIKAYGGSFSIIGGPKPTIQASLLDGPFDFDCIKDGQKFTIAGGAVFITAEKGDCNKRIWVPISNPKAPEGNYRMDCGGAGSFVSIGTWSFREQ